MPAQPADIAVYTRDGVVVTIEDAAIRSAHAGARDLGDTEIEMFFDSPADAQALLDEKFILVSNYSQPHEGVEFDESLGLGSTVPLTPTAPSFRVIDDSRLLDQTARCRSFAEDTGADRFSIEVQ